MLVDRTYPTIVKRSGFRPSSLRSSPRVKTLNRLGLDAQPDGITFFKEYAGSGSLSGLYALGTIKHVYTSTSGTPTLNANGYAATTANVDVLKYAIAGNCTAAQETIVIKFMPNTTFSGDFIDRYIFTTSPVQRILSKPGAISRIRFYTNYSQSGPSLVDHSTIPQQNVSYILAAIAVQSIGTPNQRMLINNIETYSTDQSDIDWIIPDFSSGNMYIGSRDDNLKQGNIKIAWIKIFNRVLTDSEIATLQ